MHTATRILSIFIALIYTAHTHNTSIASTILTYDDCGCAKCSEVRRRMAGYTQIDSQRTLI